LTHMEKADPNSPILTENDKEVLKKIIDQAKIPDNQIAVSMGISPQGVFKIRNKLERLGIIKGYVPIIDFRKIGINMMAVLVIEMTASVWQMYSEAKVSERLSHIPYVINVYRIAEADASHVLILGFRDINQKEKYMMEFQTKYSSEIIVKNVYSFSVDNIILQNPLNVLHEIIDRKELSGYRIFPKKSG